MNDVTTAQEVLAYGDRAVAQGTRVAEVPKSPKAAKKPPAPKPPAHVDAARSVWKTFLAKDVPGVTILDIASAPSAAVRGSTFAAWTNSATQIFVAASANASRGALLAVLHHESRHIKQFVKEGHPPTTYARMVQFEIEAYADSVAFAHTSRVPEVKQLEGTFTQLHDDLEDVLDSVASVQDPAAREAALKKALIDSDMLPPHGTIASLYT